MGLFDNLPPDPRPAGSPKKWRVNERQKKILVHLFAGATIGRPGSGFTHRLWDKDGRIILGVEQRTFAALKKFMRRDPRKGRWRINLALVRSLRKNTWVKTYYLEWTGRENS